MQISKHKVAAIHYTLTDDSGNVLDSSVGNEPLYYLHGEGNLIPGMEEGLEGHAAGDKVTIDVTPEKGYGRRNPALIEEVPKQAFGNQRIAVGMQFETNEGELITITNVGTDTVTVDANHPLADQNLHFDVQVLDVRDATPDELDHGHVHGPGGVH